ncbi:hypothetical protein Dsin_019854 [Dipteronia sinensis]|uniref:AT-hook motif nuclear-localized protein n=1 Tax=Dipteronia sinensis TaxID=43782 RepID=A0AAE0A9C2_9ROSI|nr:hypothetical protein Dsin_019854 [Dipteronia sinensis]
MSNGLGKPDPFLSGLALIRYCRGSKFKLGGYFGETAGGKLFPHVMIVATGEDIRVKIFSLCESAKQVVVVLSATGTGKFEILSLSGSFTHDKVDGKKPVTGMLSISLAKPNGQVLVVLLEVP